MLTKILLFFKSLFKSKGVYPYNDSLRTIFPDAFTPLVALDYIRELMYVTDKSMTEIEILLMIAIQDEPISFKVVADNIYHVSDYHVARVLRNLRRDGYLDIIPCKHCGEHYYLSSLAKDKIKNVDRNTA